MSYWPGRLPTGVQQLLVPYCGTQCVQVLLDMGIPLHRFEFCRGVVLHANEHAKLWSPEIAEWFVNSDSNPAWPLVVAWFTGGTNDRIDGVLYGRWVVRCMPLWLIRDAFEPQPARWAFVSTIDYMAHCIRMVRIAQSEDCRWYAAMLKRIGANFKTTYMWEMLPHVTPKDANTGTDKLPALLWQVQAALIRCDMYCCNILCSTWWESLGEDDPALVWMATMSWHLGNPSCHPDHYAPIAYDYFTATDMLGALDGAASMDQFVLNVGRMWCRHLRQLQEQEEAALPPPPPTDDEVEAERLRIVEYYEEQQKRKRGAS